MAFQELTPFEKIVTRTGNRTGACILLVLAWIVTCDDELDTDESSFLRQLSENARVLSSSAKIISIARERHMQSIQLALEILNDNYSEEQKHLFMEMAIGATLADGLLRPSENHILRMLADFFELDRSELEERYLRAAGHKLPPPSDPSTSEFWKNKSNKSNSNRRVDNDQTSNQGGNRSYTPLEIRYYSILGLLPGASGEEIRQAFRELAKVHHPDRFERLGPESKAAANATFRSIKEAYDYLKKHA